VFVYYMVGKINCYFSPSPTFNVIYVMIYVSSSLLQRLMIE